MVSDTILQYSESGLFGEMSDSRTETDSIQNEPVTSCSLGCRQGNAQKIK